MAFHFSANQFEDGYQPRRLRNWEVPKWFPSRPRTPLTTTKFIANSRGHLLPGVAKTNPWGTYKDTWQLPRHITKSYANEVNAPPVKSLSVWSRKRAPSSVQQQVNQSQPEKLPALNAVTLESFSRRNKSSTALDVRSPTPSNIPLLQPVAAQAQQSTPNIPAGTLDDEIKAILESNTAKPEPIPTSPVVSRALQVLQKCPEESAKDSEEKEEDDKTMVVERDVGERKEGKKYGGPLMNDYAANQIAKRYHDENLKHQPLPDVVDDPVFKALASNKHPFPGGALDIQPNAAAIGWKLSGAPGPTKCSKVKVYRPKTTAASKGKASGKHEGRPKTCEPSKEKRFDPIDLAICWDLVPQERPRRGNHIDGSTGGEAPAVFAVVRPEDREIQVAGSAQAVATHVPVSVAEDNVGTLPPKIGEKINQQPKKVINKSAIMAQIKPAESSPAPSYHSLSPESAQIAKSNPKTAWTNYDTSKELSSRLRELEENNKMYRKSSNSTLSDNSPMTRSKLHRSTPNLSQAAKQCEGSNCGTESGSERKPKENGSNYSSNDCASDKKSKDAKESKESRESKESKEEYKMAFKAGMPNNHTPPPQPNKPVKIPKMRPPYAKKNYAISTLIPPFSLWPDHNGQEYPEHWRLASVYQHSYKPVVSRRKPLLASVFQ